MGGQLNILGLVKARNFLQLIGGVPVDKDNNPINIDNSGVYNVKLYGALGDGVADDYSAINAALSALPAGNVWNDPRVVEGGEVYFPQGKYKIGTTISITSGSGSPNGKRQNIHLKGSGIGRTIIYSDTLKSLITADTSADEIMISDMTIMTYATFTGAGTLEKVLNFISCVNVRLLRVHVYVRYPGANNPDCVLINMQYCYYTEIQDCETTTFPAVNVAERHNIATASATVNKFGGTHIRSTGDNALWIRDHRWSNPYRGMHLINDDTGVTVENGRMESYTQGFLLENTTGCTFKGIRFETHPENYYQYEGPGIQYSVLCDEYSTRNVFSGSSFEVQSDLSDFGYLDYNGTNTFDFNNAPKVLPSKPLIRNGDFALGYYTSASVLYVPGFSISGTPTLANEASDLPPERGITRALKLTCNGNVQGIRANIDMDPEKLPGISYKFWMKRLSGNFSMKPLLYDVTAANYISSNLLISRGLLTTQGKGGLPITGTPAWSGGVLTIQAAIKNFLKVNQRVSLAGFTNSGSALSGNTYTVASIVDEYTFTLSVAADPGVISVVGTWKREGIEDVIDPSSWRLYSGHFTFRRGVISVDLSGVNAVITTKSPHSVLAGGTFRLYGFSNANFNNTFTAISVTSNTITFAKPSGSVSQTGHGTSLGSGFYGWVGPIGTCRFILGADFLAGATAGDHLLAGVVVAPLERSGEIPNIYLPGVSTLAAQVTYDPPSIPSLAAGSTTTKTVAVSGAAIGDAVRVGFSNFNAGLQWTGQVSAADTVTVTVLNTSNAAIDLVSGLLTVFVDHLN